MLARRTVRYLKQASGSTMRWIPWQQPRLHQDPGCESALMAHRMKLLLWMLPTQLYPAGRQHLLTQAQLRLVSQAIMPRALIWYMQ